REGKALQRAYGGRGTTLAVPLLRETVSLGVITLVRDEINPFAERQIDLLSTFADQAVIAIENVRLFTEPPEKDVALAQGPKQVTDALEQQTASSEILRIISQSPTNVQPVFATIVERAVRLCEGLFGTLFTFDGELMNLVAAHNWTPAAFDLARRTVPSR